MERRPSWGPIRFPVHRDCPSEAILGELRAVRQSLTELHRKADHIMSQQDDLNQVATTIEGDVATINSGVQAVQAEVAALQAAAQAGQSLDFTAVDSALSDLANSASSVTAAGAEVPPAPSGDTSGTASA